MSSGVQIVKMGRLEFSVNAKGLRSTACCHYFHLLLPLRGQSGPALENGRGHGQHCQGNLNGAGQVEDLSGATRARPVPWCQILLPLRSSCSRPASVSRISHFLCFSPSSFLFAFWDFMPVAT